MTTIKPQNIDHDHDEECDCEIEYRNVSDKVIGCFHKGFKTKRKIKVVQEWTKDDIRDFLSDHLEIDMDNPTDSTHEIAGDMYEVLMKEKVGRVNAELMSAGIEWYLDRLVARLTK